MNTPFIYKNLFFINIYKIYKIMILYFKNLKLTKNIKKGGIKFE